MNVTDPDSAIMKTKAGWVQGYNVQAAVNEDQVIVAYSGNNERANDFTQLLPVIRRSSPTQNGRRSRHR